MWIQFDVILLLYYCPDPPLSIIMIEVPPSIVNSGDAMQQYSIKLHSHTDSSPSNVGLLLGLGMRLLSFPTPSPTPSFLININCILMGVHWNTNNTRDIHSTSGDLASVCGPERCCHTVCRYFCIICNQYITTRPICAHIHNYQGYNLRLSADVTPWDMSTPATHFPH